MKPITDLHCHLLPGLDDGADTWDQAWNMVLDGFSTGTRRVVCTPHCTTGDPHLQQRTERILDGITKMNRLLEAEQLPMQVDAGMELLCGERVGKTLSRGPLLSLAGSRYLLIEFPFQERLSRMEWVIHQVFLSGKIPVLAHPERYPAVQRDPGCLGDWFEAGCILQLDKGSILGDFGSSNCRTALWALERGTVHVVASDAHNTTTRTASFRRLERFFAQHFSVSYGDLLLRHNPNRIVSDRPLVGMEREEME